MQGKKNALNMPGGPNLKDRHKTNTKQSTTCQATHLLVQQVFMNHVMDRT